MANPTMNGLLAELECYERDLEKATKTKDEKMIRYYEERIRRVKIEIQNLKNFNKSF